MVNKLELRFGADILFVEVSKLFKKDDFVFLINKIFCSGRQFNKALLQNF